MIICPTAGMNRLKGLARGAKTALFEKHTEKIISTFNNE
jgi:hypothetical protein